MMAHYHRVLAAAVLVVTVLALLVDQSLAVDRDKFRTCAQTAFCKRHRDTTEFAGTFYVVASSVDATDSTVNGVLIGGEVGAPPFKLDARFYRTGTARFRVTEMGDKPKRWESPDVLLEQDFVPAAISTSAEAPAGINPASGEAMYVSYPSVTGSTIVAVIQYDPFMILMYTDGQLVVTVNNRGLFHYEHLRDRDGNAAEATEATADPNAGKKIVDWGEDGKPIYEDGSSGGDDVQPPPGTDDKDQNGMWEESWKSHTDHKANGPTSVSADITFHGIQHTFGIPEHASSFSLKSTDGSSGNYNEPYRLYNLDVFEYELDEPMALYGSIPVMIGHSATRTAGVFWHNPSETFVDVSKDATGTHTRWISEAGVVDLMIMPGPQPHAVFGQYATLTGSQALPPMFAIGYHQCRWNYKDENDVFRVDAKFEEHNFPYDVLWLDIEHTDGKRYFTWDSANFPQPAAMQRKLAERGRKMVTIIDPHIKRDNNYHIHSEATAKGYYIKNRDGNDFDGWCWPGSSSYLDFTSKDVREWWASKFAYDQYKGSTETLYTWNDMNEPSVFNGPEVSMNKDAKSLAGAEHREWHNLYGMHFQQATAEGQVMRSNGKTRPFVLSRAFYAGSQRFGAIWTGDNTADWDHLRAAAPMLLSVNIAGLSFAGADVGGFFGNPDTELLERWYQAGSWQPFFRAHAHIDTKRREPWLFGEEVLGRVRATVIQRYTYLPYWYTTFFMSYITGAPVMRPLWSEFPAETEVFTIDDQWLVGSDIMVKPVTDPLRRTVNVYFPGTEGWYDISTWEKQTTRGIVNVQAPIDKIPVYQRAGSIVPRKTRLRRCSSLMANDPFTLDVALDTAQEATGMLYLDDGDSFAFNDGIYRLRKLTFSDSTLSSTMEEGSASYSEDTEIERLVIVGLGGAPQSIEATTPAGTTNLRFKYDEALDKLVVRKPGLPASGDWSVVFA